MQSQSNIMKLFFLLILFTFLSGYLSAQTFRYSETIFEKADTLKDVQYGMADWLNNPVALLAGYNIHNGENRTERRPLYMDIYTPHGDTLTKRPAIIFVHSGGFLMGTNQNDDMIAFCDSFARRGFVTATLGYRIGMGAEITTFFGFPIKITLSEKNAARTVYRATQDSRAAIRFLKYKAENFGIDTTKIYMVGSSAGGFVALHNLYMNHQNEIPEFALTEPTLGNIDTVGIQGFGSQANAIVSMWGALQTPELIETEKSPIFLIHGEDDDVVYFKKGMPLKTLIPDNDAIEFLIPETYGGFCIDTALTNRNVEHKTYFVPDKKHEFYGVATGMFGEEGPNKYWDTIQWKISNFLLDQFRPKAKFEMEINDFTIKLSNSSSEIFYTQWDFGDGETGGEHQTSHTYSQSGEYKIRLTTCNQNLACDTISKIVSIGTSVSTKTIWKKQVKIFPNPAQNHIYIEGISQNYNIIIYDLTGRKRKIITNLNSGTIDITGIKPGIYILEIEIDKTKIHHKFLKTE